MKLRLVFAVVAFWVVIAGLAGGGYWLWTNHQDVNEDKLVAGTFTLTAESGTWTIDRECRGTGGYSDIAAGQQVRLMSDGKLLDVQTLGSGRAELSYQCVYSFTLKVPKGHKFYDVSVGRRGNVTYTYEQLTKPGILALSLGNQP